MFGIEIYSKTAPSHAAKAQETTNCFTLENFKISDIHKQIQQNSAQPCSQAAANNKFLSMLDNTWKFNEARLISTVTAKPRQPMQPNGKKLQICWHVENACALKFDSFYSQQKHTQPCSQVAENSTFSCIWKDIWKSKLCIEIYSKTVPSHAVKCQEISLCWNMCKHRCFVRKCMAKQRPAMQPSGRKQQIV